MSPEIVTLSITAASIGFLHTLFGPDHYLPFIVMARARNWSVGRTAVVTALCGLGHTLSSVILGMVGIALGVALNRLEIVESYRGRIAAWALIAFGLVYLIWALVRLARRQPHVHRHHHADGTVHEHTHTHASDHFHAHDGDGRKSLTPWILFTVFVLGPCEPLIPILMYPAVENSVTGLILVAGIFSAVTIATMLGAVLLAHWGVNFIPLGRLERYAHVLAGAIICLSGLAIEFLGL